MYIYIYIYLCKFFILKKIIKYKNVCIKIYMILICNIYILIYKYYIYTNYYINCRY